MRGLRLILAAFAVAAAAIAGAPFHRAWADDAPRFFRIGTAATTGTYFQIGAEIANAISKPPGSRDCDRGGNAESAHTNNQYAFATAHRSRRMPCGERWRGHQNKTLGPADKDEG